jgi:hypothetical protein
MKNLDIEVLTNGNSVEQWLEKLPSGTQVTIKDLKSIIHLSTSDGNFYAFNKTTNIKKD